VNHNSHNDPANNEPTQQNDQHNNQAQIIDKASERTSKALHKIDQIIPHDNENETVQAIKHDVLETPAAILSARKDVMDMRSRGRRTLFESKKDKSNNSGKVGGKKKDRFMRRRLDQSYIVSQAAANVLPDEQQDEDSGTKGVRAMVQESAKLVKIFATAESKPTESKMRHIEDEQRLAHENTAESSLLTHEEIDVVVLLQHEKPASSTSLQHGDSANGNKDKKDSITNKTENRPPKADNSGKSSHNQDSEHDNLTTPSNTQPQSQKDIKIENKIDYKIEKYTAYGEKLERQIEKAEAKIPKQKVKISKLTHGETGKPKRQISFADEKIDKADAKWNQGQSMTLSANTSRYVTGHTSAFIHGKVSETENLTGNTGVKAAHTGEKVVAKGYSTVKNVRRYVRNKPYRKLQHLKAKEAQNKGRLAYQKLLKDKPELRKNNVARMIQKRRIRREYAKAFRAAQSGGTAKMGALGTFGLAAGIGAAAVTGDGKGLAKMGARLGLRIALKKKALLLVKAAVPILLKIGAFLLIIGAILLLFTMCAALFGTATGYAIESVSYTADMDDITEYSVYITQLEVELKEEIIEAATDLEGLHEFRFVINSPSGGMDIIFEGTLVSNGLGHPYFVLPVYAPPNFDPLILLQFLTDITHNPFEVMAYLTAAYGDFAGHDIKAILREIFDTAFQLEIVEGYEVRYAYVEAWYYELQDLGGYQDFGWWEDMGFWIGDTWVSNWVWVSNMVWVSNWQEVRVPLYEERLYYNWYYRDVVLNVNSTISDVIQDRMTENQQEHHEYLMETLGLRQFVGSPFADNWLGAVTSVFGYRFHPITMTREMHTGIDIGKPAGTPILSGAPSTVVFAGDNGGYGNTVIIEYIDEERGVGVRILYAHMANIDVAVGDVLEIGTIIGTVGSTGVATGAHLHMEVMINEDGGAWRLINPLFFVEPYPS